MNFVRACALQKKAETLFSKSDFLQVKSPHSQRARAFIAPNYKSNPDINTAAAATRATTISGISNRASITAAAVPMTA